MNRSEVKVIRQSQCVMQYEYYYYYYYYLFDLNKYKHIKKYSKS